jgi:ketosteroid isomerase-like protein
MNRHPHPIALLFVSSFLVLVAASCESAKESTGTNPQTVEAVRAVLQAQQAAWNRGDIDGFMDGYERAETTTFISGDEITRGWQTVLDRYKRSYSSREQMGTLTFSELDIHSLGPSYVVTDGRWQLTLANEMPRGRFTLLLRQTSNGWRVFHDTTTSAR